MPLGGRFYSTGVETVGILRPGWGGGRPRGPSRISRARCPGQSWRERCWASARGPWEETAGAAGPGAGAPSSLRCPVGLEVGSVAIGLAAENWGPQPAGGRGPQLGAAGVVQGHQNSCDMEKKDEMRVSTEPVSQYRKCQVALAVKNPLET